MFLFRLLPLLPLVYIAAVISPLFYPQIERTTYMSENALLPGSKETALSPPPPPASADDPHSFPASVPDFLCHNRGEAWGGLSPSGVSRLLGSSFGLRCDRVGSPSDAAVACSGGGPRSKNGEEILLVVWYDEGETFNQSAWCERKDRGVPLESADGLSLAVAVARATIGAQSTSRQVTLLVGRGTDAARARVFRTVAARTSIIGAVVFDAHGSGPVDSARGLRVGVTGPAGRLVNLDLANVAVRVAARSSISKVELARSSTADLVGSFVGDVARRYAVGPPSRVSALDTLAGLGYDMARGLPISPASQLLFHNVETISIGPAGPNAGPVLPRKVARVAEATVESLLTLDERLHQSFWFYLLLSPRKYIAIGDYAPTLAALIIPILLPVTLDLLGLPGEIAQGLPGAAARVAPRLILAAATYAVPASLPIMLAATVLVVWVLPAGPPSRMSLVLSVLPVSLLAASYLLRNPAVLYLALGLHVTPLFLTARLERLPVLLRFVLAATTTAPLLLLLRVLPASQLAAEHAEYGTFLWPFAVTSGIIFVPGALERIAAE